MFLIPNTDATSKYFFISCNSCNIYENYMVFWNMFSCAVASKTFCVKGELSCHSCNFTYLVEYSNCKHQHVLHWTLNSDLGFMNLTLRSKLSLWGFWYISISIIFFRISSDKLCNGVQNWFLPFCLKCLLWFVWNGMFQTLLECMSEISFGKCKHW